MIWLGKHSFKELKGPALDDLQNQQARWMAAQTSTSTAIKNRIIHVIKRVFGIPLDNLLRVVDVSLYRWPVGTPLDRLLHTVELGRDPWSIHLLIELEDLKKDPFVEFYGSKHSKNRLDRLIGAMRDKLQPTEGSLDDLCKVARRVNASIQMIESDDALWTDQTYSELMELRQDKALEAPGLQPSKQRLDHSLRILGNLVIKKKWAMADIRGGRFEGVETSTTDWYAHGHYAKEVQPGSLDSLKVRSCVNNSINKLAAAQLPDETDIRESQLHEQLDPQKVQSYQAYVTGSSENLTTSQVLDIIEIADALSDIATIEQILGDSERASQLLEAAFDLNRPAALIAIESEQRALFRQKAGEFLIDAVNSHDPAMIKLLSQLGATYRAKNEALAYAVQQATPEDEHRRLDSIQALLENGANPNVQIIGRKGDSPRQIAKHRHLHKIVQAMDQTMIKVYVHGSRRSVGTISRHVLLHHPYFRRNADKLGKDFKQLVDHPEKIETWVIFEGHSRDFLKGIIGHSERPNEWLLVAGDLSLLNAQLELFHHDLDLQPQLNSKASSAIGSKGSPEVIEAVMRNPDIVVDRRALMIGILRGQNKEAAKHPINQENDLQQLYGWINELIPPPDEYWLIPGQLYPWMPIYEFVPPPHEYWLIPRPRECRNHSRIYLDRWEILKMIAERLAEERKTKIQQLEEPINQSVYETLAGWTDEQTISKVCELAFSQVQLYDSPESIKEGILASLSHFDNSRVPQPLREKLAEDVAMQIAAPFVKRNNLLTDILPKLNQLDKDYRELLTLKKMELCWASDAYRSVYKDQVSNYEKIVKLIPEIKTAMGCR